MCFINFGTAKGWFDSNGKMRFKNERLSNFMYQPTDVKHTPASVKFAGIASITAMVSLIACIIIGSVSSKHREAFATAMF